MQNTRILDRPDIFDAVKLQNRSLEPGGHHSQLLEQRLESERQRLTYSYRLGTASW